jgi:DnaJ-class molecular chaperone
MSGCCDSEQKLPSCCHGLIGYCVKCETEQWNQIRSVKSLLLDEVGHLKKIIEVQDGFFIHFRNRLKNIEDYCEAKKDNRHDLNQALSAIQEEYKEMISGINSQISELCFKVNDLYQIRKNMDFKKPYKCPVCDGTGKVRMSSAQVLLSDPPQYPTEKCTSCEGKGIVWG